MSQKGKLQLRSVTALNANQKLVLSSKKNVVATGSAGTGKTFLLLYLGLLGVTKGKFDKVVVIRSSVATRDIGYLPGSVDDKMAAYENGYTSMVAKLYGDEPAAYKVLKKQQRAIEFMPTSFVRGMTIDNSFIIVDEFQNMTFHELDSIITRVGEGSVINFSGDINQSDLKKNGLMPFLDVLKAMPDDFTFVDFTTDDIVRSGLVKRYLQTKEKGAQGSTQ